MAPFRAKLKAAQQAYVQNKYTDALEHCNSALQDNDESPDGLLLKGKILFELKDNKASGEVYSAVLRIQPNLLPAWKGLAELHTAAKNHVEALVAFESLIRLGTSESKERRQEYCLKVASLHEQLGDSSAAVQHFQQLLDGPLAYTEKAQHLHVECQLADVQMFQPGAEAEEGLQSLLDSIVSQTTPDGRYAAYHAKQLQVLVRRKEKQPARSKGRGTQAKACHDAARRMMQSKPGGCCTPVPFQTALLLAEDQVMPEGAAKDKDTGRLISLVEVGRQLCHQFPWLPDSCAALGLALHDALITKGPCPSKTKDRSLVVQLLRRAMSGSADSLQGWQLLSQLQLQNGQHDLAAESAAKGLQCLAQRRSRGYQPSPQAAAGIVLTRGHSLLALDHLDDAHAMYKALTDESSASPVRQLLESIPASVQQDARRAQALVLKQQGDTAAAQQLLADLVQSEELSQQVQHLAQANYGTLLLEQGNFQEAHGWLLKAIASAGLEGSQSTDNQVAQAKLQLGSACWELGQESEEVRGQAYAHWLAAAGVPGSHQPAAFAKLGLWYADFKADAGRARKCFQRALGLNPLQAEAGEGLCNLLRDEGRADTAQALCQEVSTRAPGAIWAWRRLAFFSLDGGDYEKAVLCFQTALRGDVKHAGAWEGLGSAFQSLARLTAALKAYGRAIELESNRLFSLVQSGLVLLALGNYTEAQGLLQRALEVDPEHVPALFAAAQLLLASAKHRIAQGTPGMAGKDLAQAAKYCHSCSQHRGNLQAVWKLMGDVHLQFHATTPPSQGDQDQANGHDASAKENGISTKSALKRALDSWQVRITAMMTARRAFAKALHLAPRQGSSWGDVSATFYHEAQLRRAHPRLDPNQAHQLRTSAERLMRGGVRLEPASAALWAGLGTCAKQPQDQEYAFTRSLHLDPKSAHTWAALGRLYMESGARSLADTCFTQARSQEPADSATWAAMGALAGLSPTGGSDKADFYEHAVKLGAGAEALAGFAEGAVGVGRASSGSVYAAARKIVEAQPYNAAAHNVLGLASEARGDHEGAVQAYTDGLDVATDLHEDWGKRDQLAGPLSLVQQDSGSTTELQHALELNLARTMALNTDIDEALEKYRALEDAGSMQGSPSAWLSYALALKQSHQGNAQGQAQQALEKGMSASPGAQEQDALFHAWLKLDLAEPGRLDNLQQLFSHVKALQAVKPEVAMLQPLWLTLSAAAVASTDPSVAATLQGLVRAWRAQADDDSAEFEAELAGLSARQAFQSSQKLQASRHAARALHICPWKPLQTALAARTSLDTSLSNSLAASCMSSSFSLNTLCRATQSYRVLPSDLPNEAAVMDMLAVRVTGAVTQPCASDAIEDVRAVYKDMLHWAHSQPHNALVWYLLAAAALHYASSTHQAAAYRSALALCKRALHLLNSSAKPQRGNSHAFANGKSSQQQQQQQQQQHQQQQQQQHQQVKLHCMMSECQLHSGNARGGSEQALSCAKTAVQAAAGVHEPELTAVALQQLSRCLEHRQRQTEAEMACKKALTACPTRPSASLQLACLLLRAGKHQEALAALEEGLQKLSDGSHSSMNGKLAMRWRLVLSLQQTVTLAAMGDLDQACSVCQRTLQHGDAAGVSLQPHANPAQVMLGALSLQSAESEPDTPNAMASLSTAHKVLTQVLAFKGTLSQKDTAVVCWLLAQVELLGNLRRKQEKAEAHVMQALQLWPTPAPSSLFAFAAKLQPEGLSFCCKAVHLEPWHPAHWQLLQTMSV